MRKRIWLLWVFCLVAAGGFAQSSHSEIHFPNQGLFVLERFTGPYTIDSYPDQGSKSPDPLIIRSQEEFDNFVKFLPSQDIEKNGPDGPTHDLLALKPQFDWKHLMLLVVFDSQTLVFPPNISHVEIVKGHLKSYVEYPDTQSLIENKPKSWGAYGAVLLARSDLPVDWINPGPQNTAPRRISPMILDLGPGTE